MEDSEEKQRLDEAMRYRLHGRLEAVLGAEEANALMGELSVHDWSELATKTDLAMLRTELRGDMADLRAEFHKAMTAQTNRVFFGLVGVVAAFGGLIIAAANIS